MHFADFVKLPNTQLCYSGGYFPLMTDCKFVQNAQEQEECLAISAFHFRVKDHVCGMWQHSAGSCKTLIC